MGRTLRTLVDMRAKQRYKDAIIIDDWDHFKAWYAEHGPSEEFKIKFDKYSASICRKNPKDDRDYFQDHYYLSTHTFYGKGSWINSTEALNKRGFKGIIIRNWDAEQEGQEWPEPIYKNY